MITLILFDILSGQNNNSYTLPTYMLKMYFQNIRIRVLAVSEHQVPERQRWSKDLTMGFGRQPLISDQFDIYDENNTESWIY